MADTGSEQRYGPSASSSLATEISISPAKLCGPSINAAYSSACVGSTILSLVIVDRPAPAGSRAPGAPSAPLLIEEHSLRRKDLVETIEVPYIARQDYPAALKRLQIKACVV